LVTKISCPPPAYRTGATNRPDALRAQICPRPLVPLTVRKIRPRRQFGLQTGAVGTVSTPPQRLAGTMKQALPTWSYVPLVCYSSSTLFPHFAVPRGMDASSLPVIVRGFDSASEFRFRSSRRDRDRDLMLGRERVSCAQFGSASSVCFVNEIWRLEGGRGGLMLAHTAVGGSRGRFRKPGNRLV